MAKANITTKEGVKITVEGTPKEVADLVSQLQGGKSRSAPTKTDGRSSRKEAMSDKARPTPISLVTDLIDGGFFKKPRELSAIKNALAEQGYHYPVTSLSPTALRLVRKRHLRRIKDKKRWLYVQ
ncbi:MAG: hypothetical protein AAB442_00535 [Patescibacteria group bacterium]